MQKLRQFVLEMRRRRVFRSAGIYIIGGWVLLQVAALAFQSYGIPDTALQFVWGALIVGFPLVLIFGWRYDITAHGIVRTLPAESVASDEVKLQRSDFFVLAAMSIVAIVILGRAVNDIRDGPMGISGPWYAAEQLATAIAVLPLENLSGDSEQQFLSAGLHDALITTLSRITRLRVTSRFSSRRVTDDMSLADIRGLLGVDKVLSGSVIKEGDQIRVSMALVDVASEQTLWNDSFTRQFDGLIAMQSEVASAVAREIKMRLTPAEEEQIAAGQKPDSATYEAYLRGLIQLQKGTPQGYRRAIEIFTEAVENAPTSALAYAGLAIGYAQLGHSPFPAAGAYPRAREAAQRALEFDPNLAEAHLAVGMYKIYYEWDFSGGEAAFLRALDLNPSLVDAHYHYAWLLELLERDEEAIAFGEYTKQLNPLSPFYSSWLADQYRDAGMYEKAIAEAQTTLELNPKYPIAWLALGQTYLAMGRFDEAIEAHENLRNNFFWGYSLATTLATAGREEDAADVLEFITRRKNNPYTLSLIYGGLGDIENTINSLQNAKEEKIPWYPWLVTWFPQTEFVRKDPRIQALAIELGLEVSD